jgi:beta-arrestin
MMQLFRSLLSLYSSAQYKCQVAGVDTDVSVPPSSTLCKVFQITPTLNENKDKRGLALDGQLKHEDTNLASTTIIKVKISSDYSYKK